MRTDSPKAARAQLARLRLVLLAAALLTFLMVVAWLVLQGGSNFAEAWRVVGPAAAAFLIVTIFLILLFGHFTRLTIASLERQNQRLEALQRIGHALNATLDLDELLGLVLREAVGASKALCGQVWLDEPGVGLRVAARHRVLGAPGAPPRLVVQAARANQAAMLGDVKTDPQYVPMDRLARAAIAMPVMRGGAVIGVLQLESALSGAFARGVDEPLHELIEHAAVAINNARLFGLLERQLGESALSVEVARTVNASHNLIDVLQATVAMLANTLGYKRVAIFLREGDMLFQAVQVGYDPARCLLRLSLQQGVVGRAARLAETQFVQDVVTDPDYMAADEDVRSEIAMPLLREGKVVGVINVESAADKTLTTQDVALLTHLGPQVSVAVENARLHMEQEQRLRVMSSLHENTLDLLAELDLSDLMRTLVERAVRLAGASTAVIYRHRLDEGTLDIGATYNLPGHLLAREQPGGEGLAMQVARTGRSLVIDNYAEWPGHSPAFAEAGFESCAAVPMHSRGEVIGVIVVAHVHSLARFAPDAIQLLELFANQAAAAITNAELYMAEQQRRRTSDALREVGRVVTSSLDLNEVLQLILEQLERVLPYDSSTVMLWDGARLFITACRGFEKPDLVVGTAYAPEDGGLLLETLNSRQPCVIGDVRDEARWPRRKSDTAELRNVRAWIGVPLLVQDRTVGLLTVDSQEPDFYRPEDGQVAQAFAEQAASAIRNARLYAETQDKLAELKVLYDVAVAANREESVDQLLERAIERLCVDLGITHASVMLFDQDQQVLRVRAIRGYKPGAEGVVLRLGEGVIGTVAETGRPLLIPDVRAEPRYVEVDPDVRSELSVPIMLGSQAIGVLDVQSMKGAAFTENDLRLLSTMAGQIAAIISNAQLVDVLVASQQQLAERNRALQEMNLRLQELDRLKSQFLANMSHELRTPLNSIIGFAEVLADGLAGNLNEEQDEYVGYIHSSGQHLLSLINDVLDLSKIEAGKMKLDVRPYHLRDVVAEVQTTFAPLVARRQQHFKVDLAADLPALHGDAFRIKQVLINLLSNAHKYSPDGGLITLAAQLRDPDTVMLSVIDTGPGIKPEYHQVIFEEFRQADSGLTREFEGTGLGLTICKRLIELHGGQIWVESEYGHGATFSFVLPVVGPGGVARRPAVAPRTALIVEDDKQFAHLLSLHLRQAGYEPVTVTSGVDALPNARRLRPTLITLDIMLPDLSGWSVLQALKSDTELRDIPVLVVSVIEDPERARSLGAVDYLVKPLDRNALLAVLRRLKLAEEASSQLLEVLLVDGDPALGGTLGNILVQERYVLRQALTAEQAMRDIEERPPQLVILNLFLQDGDGAHLLEALRGSEAQPGIPVIVLTDRVIGDADRLRLSDQMRGFMAKETFTREQLIAEVRRLETFHREKAAYGPIRVP